MSEIIAEAAARAGPAAAPADADDDRRLLLDLSRNELAAEMEALGAPAFRARQVWHAVYRRGVAALDEITTLPKPLRARLAERYTIARPEPVRHQRAADATRKWLLRFAGGAEAEAVFIPEESRRTLCVSSQVGCALACRFCHTGTQRLVRNLSAGEIVGQVMLAHDALGAWPAPGDGRTLTNIVLMGMGEPLLNYDNVAKALRIVMDPDGLAFSRRRITLSTAGVAPMIGRCGAELGVNLAVSLHAVTDALRDTLVPLNRKYPLAELLAACRAYPAAGEARRITFEYVLLKDVNDSPADARALARLLRGLPAKVNLIPFNPWPGAPFESSPAARVARFSEIVEKGGVAAPVRQPRGRDIMAACGQLRSESRRARKARRAAGTNAEKDARP